MKDKNKIPQLVYYSKESALRFTLIPNERL